MNVYLVNFYLSNSVTLSHSVSSSHRHGLSICASRSNTTPPRKKKSYSSICNLPAPSNIFVHIWNENNSLWHSNRPRQVYLYTDTGMQWPIHKWWEELMETYKMVIINSVRYGDTIESIGFCFYIKPHKGDRSNFLGTHSANAYRSLVNKWHTGKQQRYDSHWESWCVRPTWDALSSCLWSCWRVQCTHPERTGTLDQYGPYHS